VKAGIAVLGGDGIGPEVTAEAIRVLEAIGRRYGHEFSLHPRRSAALPSISSAIRCRPRPSKLPGCRCGATRRHRRSQMVGAAGQGSPESGLLRLRRELGVYANLRPVSVHPALRGASSLKPEILEAWT